MEENRKLVITALIAILGGNATSLVNTVSPKNYRPDPFTGLDGAGLKAEMLAIINAHYLEDISELERIRQRISRCEYTLNPPKTSFNLFPRTNDE